MYNNVTCDDVLRAEGFDANYICDCTSAWEGQYCELDADECSASPCREQEVGFPLSVFSKTIIMPVAKFKLVHKICTAVYFGDVFLMFMYTCIYGILKQMSFCQCFVFISLYRNAETSLADMNVIVKTSCVGYS